MLLDVVTTYAQTFPFDSFPQTRTRMKGRAPPLKTQQMRMGRMKMVEVTQGAADLAQEEGGVSGTFGFS